MKTIFFLLTFIFLYGLQAEAQITAEVKVVKDPLLDYLQYMKPGYHDPEGHFSAQTQIFYFEADFSGDGHRSIFITDDQNCIGRHGDFQWLVYCPLSSGGFKLLRNGVTAWRKGPNFIGYIPELKKWGVVLYTKTNLSGQYIDGNSVVIAQIDDKRMSLDATHYPKYILDSKKLPDFNVQVVTLGQLEEKYPRPDSSNVISNNGK